MVKEAVNHRLTRFEPIFLQTQKTVLEDLLKEYISARNGFIKEGLARILVKHGAFSTDSAVDDSDENLRIGLAEIKSGPIRKVKTALEDMKDGIYGRCGNCGTKITRKLLVAIPWADTCIKCADRQ